MFRMTCQFFLLSLLPLFLLVNLTACNKSAEIPEVRIAINPWPGYEFLYLAETKGFFKQNNLNIKLLQMASLSDVQRTFTQGRSDGMASTAIEAVLASSESKVPLSIVLIPDYSNGGDMILAKTAIKDIAGLKNMTVGAEISSLGIFVLAKALQKHEMKLEHVNIVNVEQLQALEKLNSAAIDAVVTYPPFAIDILKDKQYHKVFTSSEIPYAIIDTITIRSDILSDDPDWQNRFHNAWQQALDYSKKQPEDAYTIMAERQGISRQEFEETLEDLQILSKAEQKTILGSQQLANNLLDICQTLKAINRPQLDCTQLNKEISSQY
ncbi:MAG: ABC transporter substrate-binding protein [Pseudomonadales bacterium]|nr:ABC transporter substrate-binding protein [Pseudomonadales bacterium]